VRSSTGRESLGAGPSIMASAISSRGQPSKRIARAEYETTCGREVKRTQMPGLECSPSTLDWGRGLQHGDVTGVLWRRTRGVELARSRLWQALRTSPSTEDRDRVQRCIRSPRRSPRVVECIAPNGRGVIRLGLYSIHSIIENTRVKNSIYFVSIRPMRELRCGV
jgi:hypothetical protein